MRTYYDLRVVIDHEDALTREAGGVSLKVRAGYAVIDECERVQMVEQPGSADA